MKRIADEAAPKAIGPYSQGIVSGGFLFTAGQIPLDPATMILVEGDITRQATRVFDNLEAILKASGCSFADVVKATVFLADLQDFGEMNKIYAARMGDHRPARSTVQVSRLPAGARIEIDLIARVPD
jgi:2-iminobutanoate/2-iminopropanoate deaminase